jgi:hypothetical protein
MFIFINFGAGKGPSYQLSSTNINDSYSPQYALCSIYRIRSTYGGHQAYLMILLDNSMWRCRLGSRSTLSVDSLVQQEVAIVKALWLRDRFRLFLGNILFSLLSLLMGCATGPSPAGTTSGLTDVEMVGRFGELEKAAEQQCTNTPTNGGTGPLVPRLCAGEALRQAV